MVVTRLLCAAIAMSAALVAQQAPARKKPVDDGWPDLSSFLDEQYGFLPVVAPITEPAVGYGAAGGLAFLSRPLGETKAGFGRPDITFVGGLGTENGTWAGAAGDIRHWLDDRLQTRVFAVDGSVNLDYFGLGDDAMLDQRSLRYNLEPVGVSLEARYRLGETPWWVGLNYSVARIDVSFDDPAGTPGLPDFMRRSDVGGLTPSLTVDSRDNLFTPTTGSYLELTVGLFDEVLGGDAEFQRVYLLGMQYVPLSSQWFLGLRGDAAASFGDVPFYMRPFVVLRGVPLLRYQGETMASFEAELRWQFWERLSLVGFGGVGAAWNDFDRYANSASAVAGGVGVRYEIARAYGLHAGVDVAFGPEDTVLYIQIGSAWARP
ncbi:MAG TPA: BamA/TamA family outer membrane protein [Planctomycetota bacterium]|nr:BamA/TamA family outer membrane protein [Planctomycetota bacterium]